ncbi:MAG: hypothetical protein ACTHKS_18390 [Gaiellaceae bacterium]
MSEWRALAELLVELDLTIEDLDSWATAPEDIAELQRREELRDEIQLAVRFHYVPRQLRRQLAGLRSVGVLRPRQLDPRD